MAPCVFHQKKKSAAFIEIQMLTHFAIDQNVDIGLVLASDYLHQRLQGSTIYICVVEIVSYVMRQSLIL